MASKLVKPFSKATSVIRYRKYSIRFNNSSVVFIVDKELPPFSVVYHSKPVLNLQSTFVGLWPKSQVLKPFKQIENLWNSLTSAFLFRKCYSTLYQDKNLQHSANSLANSHEDGNID